MNVNLKGKKDNISFYIYSLSYLKLILDERKIKHRVPIRVLTLNILTNCKTTIFRWENVLKIVHYCYMLRLLSLAVFYIFLKQQGFKNGMILIAIT